MVHAQVRAYMAHTFSHRKYVRDVLTPKIHAIGIATKNPFYEPEGYSKWKHIQLADEKEAKGEKVEYLKVVKMASKGGSGSKAIVTRDLKYIDRTDLTIAYMTNISKGTSDEIFYSGAIKRRPVFLLCPNLEICNHPWIVYECRFGKICQTEEELIRALKKRYG